MASHLTPIILDTVELVRELSDNLIRKDRTIGFVPTMGYLHEGHLSLVRAAKKDCDVVIVSIFVNPTQFGPTEDLETYPSDLGRDQRLLGDEGVKYVFLPSNDMMYPEGYKTYISVEDITGILCGKSRPTHFRGVATVVAKLMNIVRPHRMYMGEKDFQQIVVLETMVRDLNFSTRIVRCPIVREEDGLAMSSRNKYLDPDQRKRALCLHESMRMAKRMFAVGEDDVLKLRSEMRKHIESSGGEIDYIEMVDSKTLEPVANVASGNRVLLAVRMGSTRLIDNMQF